ncbi:hypothetical protein KC339_g34 [Hortaea werneckii]|nr:hypothetical protein KC339_g34 [Hortaea werneckii]
MTSDSAADQAMSHKPQDTFTLGRGRLIDDATFRMMEVKRNASWSLCWNKDNSPSERPKSDWHPRAVDSRTTTPRLRAQLEPLIPSYPHNQPTLWLGSPETRAAWLNARLSRRG